MSVLGFDPAEYYAGRGPIEAMAMGIELEPGQVAMRCNLVSVLDGVMTSYSAGNISSAESSELIAAVETELGTERLEFHCGVGFRAILTVKDGVELLETAFSAPHDLTDRPVAGSDPTGPAAALVQDLMERSKDILAAHPVNEARIALGLPPATQIWLFWPGMRPGVVPTFAEMYGLRAGLTSGVDLLRGLAIQTGIDYLDLPGVTDEADNDYRAQMAGALAALDDYDIVFVHVEAPDESSHAGDTAGKVQAIEHIDDLMLRQVIDSDRDDLRLMVMPDHPTPLVLKTHSAEAVPFLFWGPGIAANGAQRFTENEARATGFAVTPGHLLLQRLLLPKS
jgi:2,3-bisphosphoglycerate-independent phosphoglycerate mutase